MSRVLHLLPYLERGGTERAVLTLAQALPGWKSKVIAPPGSGEEPFREAGLLLPYLGSFAQSLKGAVASWQPDLLHLHAGIHHFFSAKKTGLPLVFTGHGYPTSFDYWLSSTLSNFWARKVICVSRAEQTRMCSLGLKAGKSKVIYNGIFRPQPDPDRAMRLKQQLGLAKERLTLVMAGRLVADKGCLDLIEALTLIPQKPQLVLAGEGPLTSELKQIRGQLGLEADLFLPGYVERIEDLLCFADLVILPSHREALPLFLLEAMASGRPIVATEVGGIPEAIGDCGLLVPAKDPQSLAEALKLLLADEALRRRLGAKGQRRWQKLFSAERMGIETEAVYNRVLGKESRGD